MARSAGEERNVLRALLFWILVCPMTGDRARAEAAAREGLARSVQLGAPHWTAQFEFRLAQLAFKAGDDEGALRLVRSCLARARRAHDRRTVALATTLLVPLAQKYPEITGEIPTLEEALAMARACGLLLVEAALLPIAALAASARGDLQGAAQWCLQGFELAAKLCSPIASGWVVLTTIELAAARGDGTLAARLQGALEEAVPRLGATMPPEYVESHERVLTTSASIASTPASLASRVAR